MFLYFLDALRQAGLSSSIKEHLMLLGALDANVIAPRVEEFYYLSRAIYVKDESLLDTFDKVFSRVFQGMSDAGGGEGASLFGDLAAGLAHLVDQDQRAPGSWDEEMAELGRLLFQPADRPPEEPADVGLSAPPAVQTVLKSGEIRLDERSKRAAKIWEKREFRNFDNSQELGTRNIKVALRRLRRFARQGAADELDLDATIATTARRGFLDVVIRPEKKNAVKLLLFLDVGGSMDPHVRLCEELFSAATSEFKNMEFFYFHNCVYESVWKDNDRRARERTLTSNIIHKFGPDYKLLFVGDAQMSPEELTTPGGSVEHMNEEPGAVWLNRLVTTYLSSVWLTPVPRSHWNGSATTAMVRKIMADRMFELTLEGLEAAMRSLARRH